MSSNSFTVKPGFAVIKFDFPCGGSICKQVPIEDKMKFLNDPAFKAAVILKASNHFQKAKQSRALAYTSSTTVEGETTTLEPAASEREEREEQDREKSEQEDREWAEGERKWAESEREWAERQAKWVESERKWAENDKQKDESKLHSRDLEENDVEIVGEDSNDELTEAAQISDTDLSDGPSCSISTGASSRIVTHGGQIRVLPRHMMKRGLKRKQQSRPKPCVKKRATLTNRVDEKICDNESEYLEEILVKKKTEAKKSDTSELGQEKCVWSEEEVECLIAIMKTMLPKFDMSTRPKKQLWMTVSQQMKKEGYLSKSDINCSVKWKNLRKQYLKLSVPDPLMKKERLSWPHMEDMNRILKDNPTVKLEHVTEVVDSVKVKGKSLVQPKKKNEDFRNRMIEIEEKRAESLASIAASQRGKNDAINKIAMAIEALANRK